MAASRQFLQTVVAGCGFFLSYANGQITVLSEFQRTDPFGQTVHEDLQDTQREILSPAVARNAIASFQVVVEVPQGKQYYFHVGLNPENAVQVNVYREVFQHQSDGRWIPDELQAIDSLPHLAKMGDEGIPGQKVAVYWLDVHVPKGAKVERIKVDPQLWIDQRWLSYPMEVRVVAAEVEGSLPIPGEAAPINLPVDASAQRVWRRKYCSFPEITLGKNTLTIRAFVERNAREDAALRSRWAVEDVTRLLGIPDASKWCGEAYVAGPKGPESYLRLRDRALRGE